MIKIGQKLPDTEVLWVRESEVKKITLSQKLAGRKVAIFGMPGAFSATCSGLHLPNIIGNKDELLEKGIEEICILTVNDPFVLSEWGRSKGIFKEEITLIGDATSESTKKVGLNFSALSIGVYNRSLCYAMLAEDGEVKHFILEATKSKITTSGANARIEAISGSSTWTFCLCNP